MSAVDVLAVMYELRDLADSVSEGRPEEEELLARADAAHTAIAELIDATTEMSRLAKGPPGGVSQSNKIAILARVDAALAALTTTPESN